MIPQIIHQTWKTNILPEKLELLHKKIKKLHPGWKIILWTDEDNFKLVNRCFPNLKNIYISLQYNIMRADVIRYVYMNVYGGYYLDLDYELFIPFDTTISESNLFLPISGTAIQEPILGNSIFGSLPGHIFWKDVLNDFVKNPPLKKFSNKFDVLKLTGPEFISNVYFKSPDKYKAYLAPKNIFHPDETLLRMKNYKEFLLGKGSQGIHHCHGNWLKENNSIINYISRWKSSLVRRLKNIFQSKLK